MGPGAEGVRFRASTSQPTVLRDGHGVMGSIPGTWTTDGRSGQPLQKARKLTLFTASGDRRSHCSAWCKLCSAVCKMRKATKTLYGIRFSYEAVDE
jgi:hypothetical protein